MNLHPPTARSPGWHLGRGAARIGRLARKELSEILRDRRTIITLLLMPLLLYPLLSFAFQQFLPTLLSSAKERELTIGVTEAQRPLVDELFFMARQPQVEQSVAVVTDLAGGGPGPLAAFSRACLTARLSQLYHEPRVVLPPRYMIGKLVGNQDNVSVRIVETKTITDLQTALSHGDVDVAVQVTMPVRRPRDPPALDWEIHYTDQSWRARLILDYLEQHVALANARMVQADLNRRGVAAAVTQVRVVRNAIAPDSGEAPLSLTAVVPLILILMTITGAVYPAIDLTAGERERGTLEILVSAPVPRMSLLLGKYIAVVTVAVLTAAINLTMMLVTLEYNQLTSLVFRFNDISVGLVLQLFFLLLLFAAFFSAVLLALTSFARSFKEAQAYLIPLMLASLAPGVLGMMPGLRLEGPLTVIPLVNIVLLARDLMEGQASAGVSVVVVLSTLIYAVAAIAVAARIFGAEAVLYSEQSGWSDLFRRPAEAQPTASVAGALFCLALTFPATFVLLSVLAAVDLDYRMLCQVLATVGLFGGLPLAGCLLARIQPRTAFQLRMPPLAAWPAALLLAPACVPAIFYVFALMREWHWTLLSDEQILQIREVVRTWRQLRAGTVVTSFAMIGVAEELFFRGYLFSALRARTGQSLTIAISTLLFALFHFVTQFDRLMPSLLMGLLLGWVCWHTRSILPGMLLHGSYNALWMMLAYMQRVPRSTQMVHEVPLWWQVAALPVGLVALGLIWWFRVPAAAVAKNEVRARTV
jgi:ABC-type Na+ efflux pump permease subunit/membrane protease YdiL (CAAX protease family)